MRQDSPPWPQPLQGLTACHKYHPSPSPHYRTLHPAVWGMRLTSAWRTNMDCPANNDTRGVPALAKLDGPHHRPSRIRPLTASSAERLWDFWPNRVGWQLSWYCCHIGGSIDLPKSSDRINCGYFQSMCRATVCPSHLPTESDTWLRFNQSNAERGRFMGNSFDRNGRHRCSQGRRPRGACHNAFSGGQFGTSSGFGPAPGVFAPDPPPGGVMPYEGTQHEQHPTGFIAPGLPACIPHEMQMQYCPPTNWYGNLPPENTPAPPFSNIMKKIELECALFMWFRCGKWPPQHDMPCQSTQGIAWCVLHAPQCPAIYCLGTHVLHEEQAQDANAIHVMVWGGKFEHSI